MNGPAKPRELPEFVDALVRIGADALVKELGGPRDRAEAVMAKVAVGILAEFARHTMYIPAGFDARNEAIYGSYGEPSATAGAYTRARVEELAAQHGLTARQVYSIIGVQRARELASRQPLLPGFDTPA